MLPAFKLLKLLVLESRYSFGVQFGGYDLHLYVKAWYKTPLSLRELGYFRKIYEEDMPLVVKKITACFCRTPILNIAPFVMALLVLACGTPEDDSRDTSVFPKDALIGVGNSGSSTNSDGSGDGAGSNEITEQGFVFEINDSIQRAPTSQVTVQQTPAAGSIVAVVNGSDGSTYTINFNFTTAGQTFPKEYDLTMDAADISPNSAILQYSEIVSNGTPIAGQSVSNDFLRVDNFSETQAKGEFQFNVLLVNEELRTIKNGTFLIDLE